RAFPRDFSRSDPEQLRPCGLDVDLLSLLLDINPRLQTGRGFSRFSMSYNNGRHTVFHHRYHIVWITKYRYKVLEGALRERIRTIIKQVCEELGVQIVSGVLSR